MSDVWMKCSACRRDLAFAALYHQCSVSTCNRARTRLVFCSVACWDSHVAELRHRDAWAVEARAPTRAAWLAEGNEASEASGGERAQGGGGAGGAGGERVEARRHVVVAAAPAPAGAAAVSSSSVEMSANVERDVLIVVSKLKKYIRDRSGMNCSDAVADVLSDHVRAIADQAIRAAGAAGRKTVLDRDIPPAPKGV